MGFFFSQQHSNTQAAERAAAALRKHDRQRTGEECYELPCFLTLSQNIWASLGRLQLSTSHTAALEKEAWCLRSRGILLTFFSSKLAACNSSTLLTPWGDSLTLIHFQVSGAGSPFFSRGFCFLLSGLQYGHYFVLKHLEAVVTVQFFPSSNASEKSLLKSFLC